MIEETLITYGPLGIWTASLLFEKFKTNKDMKDIIKNNTIAITKVYEVLTKCHSRKTTKV